MKTCKLCERPEGPGVTFEKNNAVCWSCRGKRRRGTDKREAGFEITLDEPKDWADRQPQELPPTPPMGTAQAANDEPIARLVRLTKKGPIAFSDICDALDLSPSKAKNVIDAARARGVDVRANGDHVGIVLPEPDSRVLDIDVAPTVGETQRVAIISDTHLGSKYCLRAQLRDFIEYAYSRGCRRVLHPGDVLDGDYRHGKFEMSHMGIEAQTQDLFETLPQKDGLRYVAITGNHDFTFTEESGVDAGLFVQRYFQERGRDDFRAVGNRSAFVRVGGAVVHLWHPSGGTSYAVSYKLQKRIEAYSSGEKPHILLAGHWHRFCHVYERGVRAFACPTFQGGGSAFGKSLASGAPAIGGMILEWDMTAIGTMRNLREETRFYFEREQPHRIDDRDGGIAVERGA